MTTHWPGTSNSGLALLGETPTSWTQGQEQQAWEWEPQPRGRQHVENYQLGREGVGPGAACILYACGGIARLWRLRAVVASRVRDEELTFLARACVVCLVRSRGWAPGNFFAILFGDVCAVVVTGQRPSV